MIATVLYVQGPLVVYAHDEDPVPSMEFVLSGDMSPDARNPTSSEEIVKALHTDLGLECRHHRVTAWVRKRLCRLLGIPEYSHLRRVLQNVRRMCAKTIREMTEAKFAEIQLLPYNELERYRQGILDAEDATPLTPAVPWGRPKRTRDPEEENPESCKKAMSLGGRLSGIWDCRGVFDRALEDIGGITDLPTFVQMLLNDHPSPSLSGQSMDMVMLNEVGY